MTCTRKDCFYHANGACVSLSVLSSHKCANFLHKALSRRSYKPNRAQLARLRQHLEQHAPAPHPRIADPRALNGALDGPLG